MIGGRRKGRCDRGRGGQTESPEREGRADREEEEEGGEV